MGIYINNLNIQIDIDLKIKTFIRIVNRIVIDKLACKIHNEYQVIYLIIFFSN